MAITTSIITSTTSAWTDLGLVSVGVFQNGYAGNRFVIADSTPATSVVDGFRLPVDVPVNFFSAPSGFVATHIWVCGINGTGQVIVAH